MKRASQPSPSEQAGQPVVSVDAKKKELVGDFANKGREYRPKGQPPAVRVYDFPDKALGKVCPYGVYDMTGNQGWVSVGTDHDTAQFAVESLRRWWYHMGRKVYPQAAKLLITADGGGSNASRNRLWKVELQRLADETGLTIQVCHFPPGTSKGNKIEHRMFCHITKGAPACFAVPGASISGLVGAAVEPSLPRLPDARRARARRLCGLLQHRPDYRFRAPGGHRHPLGARLASGTGLRKVRHRGHQPRLVLCVSGERA